MALHLRQKQISHDYASSVIFSPSVARVAASTARDWSYIDAWLASTLPPGRPLPTFERNPDTLKALLALASINEAADEERSLIARADTEALQELTERQESINSQPQLRRLILSAVEDDLPREGKAALDAMAAMTLTAPGRASLPDPERLSSRMLQLQHGLYEIEHLERRIEPLQRYIDINIARTTQLLRDIQSEGYQPPSDAAKCNLDLQRRVKAMSSELPDTRDRVTALATSSHSSALSLGDISQMEQEHLARSKHKKHLDQRKAVFRGLSSDPDTARSELDALRLLLRSTTSQRDATFEGLVERESPTKKR